jgi:hypothetical protein
LTPTGEVLGSFDSPGDTIGLAWDGESLWNLSEGNSNLNQLKVIELVGN